MDNNNNHNNTRCCYYFYFLNRLYNRASLPAFILCFSKMPTQNGYETEREMHCVPRNGNFFVRYCCQRLTLEGYYYRDYHDKSLNHRDIRVFIIAQHYDN